MLLARPKQGAECDVLMISVSRAVRKVPSQSCAQDEFDWLAYSDRFVYFSGAGFSTTPTSSRSTVRCNCFCTEPTLCLHYPRNCLLRNRPKPPFDLTLLHNDSPADHTFRGTTEFRTACAAPAALRGQWRLVARQGCLC